MATPPKSPNRTVKFKPTGTAKGDRQAAASAGAKSFGLKASTFDKSLGIGNATKATVTVGILKVDSAAGTAVVFKKELPRRGAGRSGGTPTQQRAKDAK